MEFRLQKLYHKNRKANKKKVLIPIVNLLEYN